MSAAVFIRPSGRAFPARHLLMFSSFACGAVIAVLGLFQLPDLPSERILFGLLLGGLLFLSASGFGMLLLPVGMAFYGLLSQSRVLSWYSEWNGSFFPVPSALIVTTICVPLVYLAAFHGFCAASSLRRALFRASPTARSEYQSEMAAASLFVLFTLSVVFYFT